MNIKKSQNVSYDPGVVVTPEMQAKGVFDSIHPNVKRDVPVATNGQPIQVSTLPKDKTLTPWEFDPRLFIENALHLAYQRAGGDFPAGTFDYNWMNLNKTNIINRVNGLKFNGIPIPDYYKQEILKKLDERITKRSMGNTMNKKQIAASLNKIANELDNNGLYTEANSITMIMKKLAQFDGDMGGDDPNIAREFDATENADKFLTKEYTIILRNNDYEEEIMRIPASRVVKSYMFNLESLINSLRKAGFGPGMEWGPDIYGYDSFDDGFYPKIDRENKTITLDVQRYTGQAGGETGRFTTDNPQLDKEFYRTNLDLESRKKQEEMKRKEMDAFYPQI
jgi:hypothetical protein